MKYEVWGMIFKYEVPSEVPSKVSQVLKSDTAPVTLILSEDARRPATLANEFHLIQTYFTIIIPTPFI